jgi:hypothetical protein
MKEKKTKILDLNNDSFLMSKISNDKEELNLNMNSEQEEDDDKITIIPFKKYFLKIFKGKYHYYILDRLKYDINTIMMLLDLNKINHLSEIFKEYEDQD